MLHLPKEPIQRKLVVLAGVLLLMLVAIMSTEFYLRQVVARYEAAVSNQMAHRRLGRVIIRELISIERDVARLATATDIRDIPVLNQSIAASLDSITTTLGVLQHGGTFFDVLPANLNEKDWITETVSYRRTDHADYTIAVIDLTPKIMEIKEVSAEFLDAAQSHLAEIMPDARSRQDTRMQLLRKRLRTDLQRARENATKVFYESNHAIQCLQQSKIEAESYVNLSELAMGAGAIAIGVLTFSRVFRRIGHIIQNRRLVEKRARTLKQQMEFILDATRTGLDIIAPDYSVKYVSPGWERIYGDSTGRKCYEYFMDRQSPCEGCSIETAFETKNTVVTEELLVREDDRPTQTTTIPYEDDQGHWLAAQVKVDITERKKLDARLQRYHTELEDKVKERTQELVVINESLNREIDERIRAEQQAQESQEALQTIIDSMPVGIVITGKDKTVRQANREALSLTGHARIEDFLGRQCHCTFCPTEKGNCPILDRGQPVNKAERMLITCAGEKIPILKSVVSVVIGQEELLLETFTDIRQLKAAEAELERTTQDLIEASHQAGKAEVAINVLHNVGNVLNSINVSTSLINDIVTESKASNLKEVAGMIQDHLDDLGTYLSQDARGKVIPGYLVKATNLLCQEQNDILAKITCLTKDVNHIKEIIRTQQACARSSGIAVHTTVEAVLEDALRINHDGLKRRRVQVKRHYAELGEAHLNKQKLVQILVNLIANAKEALEGSPEDERILTLRYDVHDTEYVRIEIVDNGMGIAPEHLVRIFNHGFTTKKHGHGFGLHSAALAAKEMEGSLSVASDGIGQGARFILDIPFIPVGANECATP